MQVLDCLHIAGAKSKSFANSLSSDFCGRKKLASGTASSMQGITTCSKYNLKRKMHFAVSAGFLGRRVPFHIRFRSDGFEFIDEAKIPNVGFKLQYMLDNMCETPVATTTPSPK